MTYVEWAGLGTSRPPRVSTQGESSDDGRSALGALVFEGHPQKSSTHKLHRCGEMWRYMLKAGQARGGMTCSSAKWRVPAKNDPFRTHG